MRWDWTAISEGAWAFINSNFSAAFFGACAGAWAAHYIGTRSERKKELLKEIRSTDAAIALAANVIIRVLALKAQQVQKTVGNYLLRRSAVKSHFEDVRAGRLPPEAGLNVQLDLNRLDPLTAPVERLETVVLEELSARGRLPQLAITLRQRLEALNNSVEQRNDFITEFKSWDATEAQKALRFFGLPYEDHSTDTSYLDSLTDIGRGTDDCIWFAKRLCRDLEDHANVLRKRFKMQRFRGEVHKVVPINISKAHADGLVPSDDEYGDWMRSFVILIPPSRGRHFGKTLYSLRATWRWPWKLFIRRPYPSG